MKGTIILSGAAGLTLLSASGLAQEPPQTRPGEAEAGWRAIAECARIGSPEPRHDCLDDVIRRAGLLNPAREEQAAHEDFGIDARRRADKRETRQVAVTPPAVPANEAVRTARAEAPRAESNTPKAADKQPDRLKTTVRSAQLSGNRRLIVVTVDGAVWEQTQSEDLRVLPKPGDPFEIQPGALGSYRCKFERSSVYRCRRVD